MDCWMIGGVRCCSDKLRKQGREYVPFGKFCMGPRRLAFIHYASTNSPECHILSRVNIPILQLHRRPILQLHRRHAPWRTYAAPVSLDNEPASAKEDPLPSSSEYFSQGTSEKLLPQQLTTSELKSLLSDSERAKILRKLSEANQHNRFLKRQLQIKDDTLVNFKSELSLLEYELQALVSLAEEIANSGIPPGSRRISGKYIQSHLLSRLEAAHGKVKEHVKDVEAVKFQEVTLFWAGMAESVQVMGSFDGWSQGEEMSPEEYTGAYAKFSATLKLRPGRYEIKFVVDGQWQLSPELPTMGEGLLENNLLIVE